VAYSAGSVFLAADADGLMVVDVSQPDNPTLRGGDVVPGGGGCGAAVVELDR